MKRTVSYKNPPLPTINGVSPSSQWLPEGDWETVLAFLTDRFPRIATSTWLTRMAQGGLVDETGKQLNALTPYRAGACLFYYRELDAEQTIPFEESVLYQDEHILVADKPHFLPVVPAGRFLRETLLVRLKKKFKLAHLVPVHRLDRETAGVVLFSVNAASIGRYTSLFRDRQVVKVYEAIAPSHATLSFPLTRRSHIVRGEPFFRMKEIAGEPNSETLIEIIEGEASTNRAVRYRLSPLTGKKHQLRLHMSSLGIPILNDRLYPESSTGNVGADEYSQPLKLLAKTLQFVDPFSRRSHCFESRLALTHQNQ
jgi:tRNA pseudouridine32 synthase/23S rRNA pseudouridine746 synthase